PRNTLSFAVAVSSSVQNLRDRVLASRGLETPASAVGDSRSRSRSRAALRRRDPGRSTPAASTAAHSLPIFRDVAREAGLDFIHVNGASDEKFLPEIIGGGGLLFDFDND